MRGKFLTCVVLGMSFLYSCNRSTKVENSTTENYKLFNLEQAGWKSKSVTQQLSNLSYTATLVPIQYYILKELGEENRTKVDSVAEHHKLERVIELEFQHNTKDDVLLSKYTKKDYESSVKYIASTIAKDFMIVTTSGDSINCSGVTLERNFKIAPFKRVLLYFGNVPEEEQIQLVYQDELFGNGILKFKFKEIPLKL